MIFFLRIKKIFKQNLKKNSNFLYFYEKRKIKFVRKVVFGTKENKLLKYADSRKLMKFHQTGLFLQLKSLLSFSLSSFCINFVHHHFFSQSLILNFTIYVVLTIIFCGRNIPLLIIEILGPRS